MTKNRFALVGCSLLVVLVELLAACRGVSPREQALEATVVVLQTRAAKAENPSASPTANSLPTLAPTAILTTVTPLTTGSVTDTLAARIDQYIRDYNRSRNPEFSGTLLIARQGKVLVSQGFGSADQENEVPNAPQTKFAIGSMGKAFTAMAIMILQERGQLKVTDPICQYVADCPAAWKPITLDHLLTHTSGITSYTALQPKFNICQKHRPEEVIAYFKDLALEFAPGSEYRYSNSGYFLLGTVIEQVSGERYETFVQKNIFQPLSMTESGYDRSSAIVKNRASGYSTEYGQMINAPCWDVSLKYAAGGWYSTVGDLYKWDQALYTDQLISKEALSKMFTSTVSIAGYDGVYGYGWEISRQDGRRVVEHGGGVYGFASHIARYPDDRVVIVVLTNSDALRPASICRELAAIVFKESRQVGAP